MVLGNRRAAFHPVAGIDVAYAANVFHDSVMDMAADDTIGIFTARLIGNNPLEFADEVDRMLDLQLRPGRERPIGHSETAADGSQSDIDDDRHVVGPVTEIGEQAGIADHDVEFVAMQNQIFAAVGCLVHVALGDLDAAEMHAGKVAHELVVVAWNIDDAAALTRLPQQLLDDVVARLRPVPAALQPPSVDDIADQDDCLRLGDAQEIEEIYPRPGKLEIQATKPLGNQRDLALAYSPGVAAPARRSSTIPTAAD
jgi:hypothetical protein